MAHANHHTTFTGSDNRGVQIGQNLGHFEYHHHPPERPETPPAPSILIPFSRDADFIDRGSLTSQIQQRCAVPGSRTALVGLGGTGKSQLAIEYAYRARAASPATWVLWVHASNAARFEQSCRDIADKAKIFGRREPKANIFRLVRDWLQDERRRWVLILDNVDDASFLRNAVHDQPSQGGSAMSRPMRDYLPQCSNGCILITSRSRAAVSGLVEEREIMEIGPMSPEDAQTLFETKLRHQNHCGDATELVAALEHIPLAIVQAAAYISQRRPRCSVPQYLEEFRRSDRKKTSLLDYNGGELRRDYEARNSVILTWHISFEHIRQTTPAAADLLALMSFFDRQGIPETLLRQQSEDNEGVGARVSKVAESDEEDSGSQISVSDGFEDSVVTLRQYSLVRDGAEGGCFEMHSLVQLAMRKWLASHGQLERWKRQYIENLGSIVPNGEPENWQVCQMLFPHVKSVLMHRPKEHDLLEEWASILHKGAWYALRMGNGEDAATMAERAMRTRQQLFSMKDERVLKSMEMVGLVYNLQGRRKEAEELEVQVMETCKTVLGADHPYTLISMANLALTYSDQGRWKEAEELGVQVIEMRKMVLGAEHPDTLISMGNLVAGYLNQGRWKEAEELGVQVIEMCKTVLRADHPNTLTSMANLTLVYWNQGRWKEAEELGVQVIETRKMVLGADHPDTVISMANLALTYSSQGRWKEAEELGVQVMETNKIVLGAEHPNTLTSIANLAAGYRNQGRWKEAEELEVQVMETRKMVLGADNPDTVISMANLASTYSGQGRWKEAEELGVQVMETNKKVLRAEHPYTLISMGNLVLTYSGQGRWKEAEELGVQVTETRKMVLGAEHPDTLTSMANLASAYSGQGRWKEAEELGVQVMETNKKVLGAEHPNTLTGMVNLVLTYSGQGRWKEAEELGVQVMETCKMVLGAEHPNTLSGMSNLAKTWKSLGQDTKALKLMEECVQLRTKVLGTAHPYTASSSETLLNWKAGE